MAWTTSIVEKTKDSRVLVRFVEDTIPFLAEQTVDPRFIDAEIRAAIVRYDALISKDIGSYTPAPLPPPPDPDPDRSKLDIFIAQVNLLRNYQELINIGGLPSNDSDAAAIRTQIRDFIAANLPIKTKLVRSI